MEEVVYTCPKCGGNLNEICLASMPPQYKMMCCTCGWSETKKNGGVKIVKREWNGFDGGAKRDEERFL